MQTDPIPADQFSQYYADLIDDTYDCADRIVMSAYFPIGQSGGGFRSWWRDLMGNEERLDDAHLRRFAGRFARRVEAFCRKNRVQIIFAKTGERKQDLVEPSLPADASFRGVFCVIVGRAKASVMRVERRGGKIINIGKKHPLPFVNLYHFHIMDPEWGHLIIRFCPHPPFSALVVLNGHELVAREAAKCGIAFTKDQNCFTSISNPAGLATVAETLSHPGSVGRLEQVCGRWIYTACLSFALTPEEQIRTRFTYRFSLCQMEYSRNLLFTRGRVMEILFDELIARTWKLLDMHRLKKIFGFKRRPFKCSNQGDIARCEAEVVRPTWDLTVFKVHWGGLTVKIYTKGVRTLRIEAVAHRVEDLRCGKGIVRFPKIYAALRAIVYHFLCVIRSIDAPSVDLDTLDSFPLRSTIGTTTVPGIDITKPRMRALIEALIALSVRKDGFVLHDLTSKVNEILSQKGLSPTPHQVAYDLKKLRAKRIVHKIGKTHRYIILPESLRVIAALILLQDKVIRPIIAGVRKPKTRRNPKDRSLIDQQYERIHMDMIELFDLLKFAA
jgi:hypothetical protein